MDHRSLENATNITKTYGATEKTLSYFGGTLSPEMSLSKLVWLKQRNPESFNRMKCAMELPDFLAWKAIGSDVRDPVRGLNSVVCKWGFSATKSQWPKEFLHNIGFMDHDIEAFGSDAKLPGTRVGVLSGESKKLMGLEGCDGDIVVGAGIIDAYAGALGVLGGNDDKTNGTKLSNRLAVIAGTSSCHLALSPSELFVPNVWGPYKNVLISGYSVSEAGQSCTGKLLDHLIMTHPGHQALLTAMKSSTPPVTNMYNFLNNHLQTNLLLRHPRPRFLCELVKDIHILPDFHGNRSPFADATFTGMITGLTLETHAPTIDSLALLYLTTLTSLAYQTRHIISHLNNHGHQITQIMLCGGFGKNELFVSLHADVCRVEVCLPNVVETVPLGAAMLGACAFFDDGSGDKETLIRVMKQMGKIGRVVTPTKDEVQIRFHDAKYACFLKMYKLMERQREFMKHV